MEAKRNASSTTSLPRDGPFSSIKYELRKRHSPKKKRLTQVEKVNRKDKKRKQLNNANEKMENIIQKIQKEIDQQLDPETEENDFLTTNKDAILKVLIMDEQMKDMVRKTLHPGDKTCYEPKLTRAKLRDLLKLRPDLCLPMPVQTRNSNFVSECLLLIQDYSDNSSEDEEYRPEEDDDDEDEDDDKSEYADSLLTSEYDYVRSVGSVDLQQVSETNPFEENICHRTRSKLPLTEKHLEDIERNFQPPDVTPDMYETEHDNDDWYNFIREISNTRVNTFLEHLDVEDDPEDPEYTFQAGEEVVDREELRKDKDVEVPSNELNDLITEFLKNCEPTFPMVSNLAINESQSGTDNLYITNPEEVPVKTKSKIATPMFPKSDCPILTNSQKCLLDQQIRQHVQLTLTHFLQCYKHPALFMYAKRMKLILENLQTLAGFNKKSAFYASNLDSALKFIRRWEDECEDIPMPTTVLTQKPMKDKFPKTFPSKLMKMICKSDAFLYPLMLPERPFLPYIIRTVYKKDMIEPEEWLLASGLEQFTEYVQNNQKATSSSNVKWEALKLISYYIFSKQFTPSFLKRKLDKRALEGLDNNSLKYYWEKKKAPPLKHYVIPISSKPLCFQPLNLLPSIWRQYIEDNFFVIQKEN